MSHWWRIDAVEGHSCAELIVYSLMSNDTTVDNTQYQKVLTLVSLSTAYKTSGSKVPPVEYQLSLCSSKGICYICGVVTS